MENNRTYFMRRAAQERAAALRSAGKAKEAHQLMAEHYEELSRIDAARAEAVSAL